MIWFETFCATVGSCSLSLSLGLYITRTTTTTTNCNILFMNLIISVRFDDLTIGRMFHITQWYVCVCVLYLLLLWSWLICYRSVYSTIVFQCIHDDHHHTWYYFIHTLFSMCNLVFFFLISIIRILLHYSLSLSLSLDSFDYRLLFIYL